MDDVWHDVEFVLGLVMSKKGPRAWKIWSRGKPEGSLDADVRLVRVKLEVPESMWMLPAIRGKLKSELKAEYEAFMEEING
jgi:hypothetical protein